MSDPTVADTVDLVLAQANADAAALETMVDLATTGQLNRDLVEGIESYTDRPYITDNVSLGLFSEQPSDTGVSSVLDNLVLLTVEQRQDIVGKYLTGVASALGEVTTKLKPLTTDIPTVDLSGVQPVTSHSTKCTVWARTFSTRLDDYIQNNPGQINNIGENVNALKLCADRAEALVSRSLAYNDKFKDAFRGQQWLDAQALSREMWTELSAVFKATWADDGLTAILSDMENNVEPQRVPDVQPGSPTPATQAESRAGLTNANVQAWAKASAENPATRDPAMLANLLLDANSVADGAKALIERVTTLQTQYTETVEAINTAQGSIPRTVMDESAAEVSKMALAELLDGNQLALEMIAANVKTMAGYAEALSTVHLRAQQIQKAAATHFCNNDA